MDSLQIGDRIRTKTGETGEIIPPPRWEMPFHVFVRLDDAPKPNPRWILREAIQSAQLPRKEVA